MFNTSVSQWEKKPLQIKETICKHYAKRCWSSARVKIFKSLPFEDAGRTKSTLTFVPRFPQKCSRKLDVSSVKQAACERATALTFARRRLSEPGRNPGGFLLNNIPPLPPALV